MTDALAQLSEAGVSIWLDDLSRELLARRQPARLIDEKHVVGVTTNPTIFAVGARQGRRLRRAGRDARRRGADVDERAVRRSRRTTSASACDVLRPVYDATDGQDGRVSIEVDPRPGARHRRDRREAKQLWATVDRPNVMIKIPATVEGLPAITQTIAAGISVNVTLIFSSTATAPSWTPS